MSDLEHGDLATLNAALEEHFGGQVPPDLTARILRAADSAPMSRAGPSGSRWFMVAAVMLASIGALYWIHRALRENSEPRMAQGVDDIVRPKTVDEAEKLLRSTKQVAVRVVALFAGARTASLDDSVSSFNASFSAQIDSSSHAGFYVPLADEKAVIGHLLRVVGTGIAALPVSGTQHDPAWSHRVEVGLPAGRTMVVRLAGFTHTGLQGQVAIHVEGLRGAFAYLDQAGRAFFEKLLCPHVRALMQNNGLALNAADLDRLPANSRSVVGLAIDAHELARLSRFAQITDLRLEEATYSVSTEAIETIAGLSTLRSLALPVQQITAKHLEVLAAGLPNLRELFLVSGDIHWSILPVGQPATRIDGACATILARMKGLRELRVLGSVFADVDLAKLAGLSELRMLSLPRNTVFSGEGLAAFREHRSLRFLNLDHCTGLSDAGVEELQRIPKLVRVSLSHVRHVIPGAKGPHPLTSKSLILLSRAAQLEHLTLDAWFRVTQQSPMRESKNAHLADDWLGRLGTLAAVTPRLRTLSLLQSPDLTDADLTRLHKTTRLRNLYFSNTPNITPAGWSALCAALPDCRIVVDGVLRK